MKSPFLYAEHRSWTSIRLEGFWVFFISFFLMWMVSKLIHFSFWHTLLTFSSPWVFICTWGALRLSLPASIALSAFMAIALDQLAGLPAGPLLCSHLLATALTRLVRLSVNFSLALSIALHVFFWSLFYDLTWISLTLAGPFASKQTSHEWAVCYQYPLMALKDMLIGILCLYLPLNSIQQKFES